jgi:hypothetical protein
MHVHNRFELSFLLMMYRTRLRGIRELSGDLSQVRLVAVQPKLDRIEQLLIQIDGLTNGFQAGSESEIDSLLNLAKKEMSEISGQLSAKN